MIHLSPATPERFSALASNPADDLVRLQAAIDRGAVDPAHLLVATATGASGTTTDRVNGNHAADTPDRAVDDDADRADALTARAGTSADVGRVGLYRAGDGTVLTYRWDVRTAPSHDDTPLDTAADSGPDPRIEEIHRTLAGGIADLARRAGLAPGYTTVVDADDDNPEVRRRALLATGWENDGDRLELEMPARECHRGGGIEDISPFDDAVIAVMSAAMSLSADTYDVQQVQALGASRAAEAYRDMMADGEKPWLAHRGPNGIDGIAAIQRFPTDWCLGYLGVIPEARGQGVDKALARAVVSATAEAGIGQVTASVAVDNPAIRATLGGVGFTTRSPRTDFVIRPSGPV